MGLKLIVCLIFSDVSFLYMELFVHIKSLYLHKPQYIQLPHKKCTVSLSMIDKEFSELVLLCVIESDDTLDPSLFLCSLEPFPYHSIQPVFKVRYRASTQPTVHIANKCGESRKFINFQYVPTEYTPLPYSYNRNTCVEYNCVFNIDKFSSFLTKELLDFTHFFV